MYGTLRLRWIVDETWNAYTFANCGMASSVAEQIQEYESQLADVESLLAGSPEDSSLLSLKSDLMELLNLTRSAAPALAPDSSGKGMPGQSTGNVFDRAMEAALGQSVGREEHEIVSEAPLAVASFADTVQEAADAAVPRTVNTFEEGDVSKKKIKAVKAEFEVPKHLIALDTDTTAERNKKQRALKALKSKWRESKKDMESTNKQKSWQSFQKKKKITSTSMFKTGDDSAVGVVSASGKRQLTDYGERKRHKHDG